MANMFNLKSSLYFLPGENDASNYMQTITMPTILIICNPTTTRLRNKFHMGKLAHKASLSLTAYFFLIVGISQKNIIFSYRLVITITTTD